MAMHAAADIIGSCGCSVHSIVHIIIYWITCAHVFRQRLFNYYEPWIIIIMPYAHTGVYDDVTERLYCDEEREPFNTVVYWYGYTVSNNRFHKSSVFIIYNEIRKASNIQLTTSR